MSNIEQQEANITPERLIADAVLSIKTLDQSRREQCGEYNERIRKLRAAIESLQNARTSSQDDMFGALTVDPDVMSLIANPLHGL